MMEKEAVLIIDDEPKILELIKSYLEKNGFTALCAPTGREGMALFGRNPVSLILLDIMLPDCSGEDMCKQIRQTSSVPIIMITARADEASIIRGLSIGADDYVTKPFSPRQLVARVQAALRRSGIAEKKCGILSYKDLIVDTENRTVSRSARPVSLTRDEYNILALLMSRPSKIFTRDEILEAVKGDDFEVFDRAVDTHIKKLRAKIEDNSRLPHYIGTVYGVGYRMGGDK